MAQQDDRIRDKIKAMLAKAKPGSGATEGEAASAMAMAMAMMAKHGIQVSMDEAGGEENPPGWGPQTENNNYMKWHLQLAGAASMLYMCKHFVWQEAEGYRFQFVGRPENTDAAHFTFLWLVEQVEALYKEALPPGLSKKTRAELRRTFKLACALRVRHRAWDMVAKMASNDILALAATGSTALVVQSHMDQLQSEAESLIKEKSTGLVKLRDSKAGIGTLMGFKAGERVKLNEQVEEQKKKKPKALQLEHKK